MSNKPTLPPSPGKRALIVLGVSVFACVACLMCAVAGSAAVNYLNLLQPTSVAELVTPLPVVTDTVTAVPSATPAPSSSPMPTASQTPYVITATYVPTPIPTRTIAPTNTPAPSRTGRPSITPTPSPTRDTIPPVITNATAAPNPLYYAYSYCGTSLLTVTASITDNVSPAPSATLNYAYWKNNATSPSSATLSLPMTRQSRTLRGFVTTYYSATVDVMSGAGQYIASGDGLVQYWIDASDDAGNISSSARQFVGVVYCLPPIR